MRHWLLLVPCMLWLSGCTMHGTSSVTESLLPLQEQTVEQLHLPEAAKPSQAFVRAMWFPATDFADLLAGKDESTFRGLVEERLQWAADLGVNTIFVQVRSNGDAYYTSTQYPRGAHWSETQQFDPLAVFLEAGHALGLAVHAWVNPLRCQTEAQMAALPVTWQTKQWVMAQSDKMVLLDGRWYLNPAYAEVRALICAGVQEILQAYPVDGVQIDDYFYPTTDAAFDAASFAAAKAENLAAWRTENVSAMVSAMYQAVKSAAPDCVFSISPRGDLDANLRLLYADVARWCREPGFCDWIIPQLYFGFAHETCAFVKTAEIWCALPRAEAVQLLLGICTYKIGGEDVWAGSGRMEWQTEREIPARQIAWARAAPTVAGVAIYSDASTLAAGAAEAEAIRLVLSETVMQARPE